MLLLLLSLLLATFLVSVFVVVALLLRYHIYWIKRGVPYLGTKELLLTWRKQFTTSGHEFYLQLYENYGKHHKVFGFFNGISPAFLVSDLDLVNDVLVKDFWSFDVRFYSRTNERFTNNVTNVRGETWKKQRTIISGVFTAAKLKVMTAGLNVTGDQLVEAIRKKGQVSDIMDFEAFAAAYTMDSAAKAFFATNINSQENPDCEFVQNAKGIFSSQLKLLICTIFPRFADLVGIKMFDDEKCGYYVGLLKQIMEERRKTKVVYNDVTEAFQQALENGELSEEEFNGNVLGLLTVAAETTMAPLMWIFYYFAQNPEKYVKALQEVDKTIGCDRNITYDQLNALTYIEACFKETMRLGSTDPLTQRTCTQSSTIDGIPIEPFTVVIVPGAGIHRDPAYFEEPNAFIPERFLPEHRDKINPVSYLAFGHGPRHCSGMRVASIVTKMAIAKVLQNFNIEACAMTPKPETIKLEPIMIPMKSKMPLYVKVTPRFQ